MANPTNTIKSSFNLEFAQTLRDAVANYVASQSGENLRNSVDSVSWEIVETPANTYSYQSSQKETVPGYRKRDGTYVNSYERRVEPIKVPIDENLDGLDQAIDQAVGMLVANIQSKV